MEDVLERLAKGLIEVRMTPLVGDRPPDYTRLCELFRVNLKTGKTERRIGSYQGATFERALQGALANAVVDLRNQLEDLEDEVDELRASFKVDAP